MLIPPGNEPVLFVALFVGMVVIGLLALCVFAPMFAHSEPEAVASTWMDDGQP